MTRVVYKSNKATIGDGLRITRVSDGGQKLEVLTDAKAGTYSEVMLLAEAPAPIDPPPGPIDPPPPPPAEPPAPVGTLTPATLPAALVAAIGGETLRLAPGNYGILASVRKYTKPVMLVSVDPANPAVFTRIELTGAANITFYRVKFKYAWALGHNNAYRAFRVDSSEDINFLDCEFEGDNAADGLPASDGLGIQGSKRVVVDGCKIHGFRSGIHTLQECYDVTLINNEIYDNRSDGMLIVATHGILIENNHIHDFRAAIGTLDHRDMIQFWTNGAASASSDIVIRGNLLDIGQGAFTQSIFMRNEEVDTGRHGVEFYYQNILIENNTIRNCQTHGTSVGATTGLIIRNNSYAYVDNDNPVTLANIAKWGATAGILIPRINAFAGAVIEGNTFSGAPWFTGPRVI